jgi:diguanylate cyclase (GGDEF)-like protein
VTNQVLIGIAAALGACSIGLLGLLAAIVRRSGHRADERVNDVVRAVESRMDELAHELAGAVARADEEGRRSRFLGEIAGTIDLDEVLERTVEGAAETLRADAALVRLEASDGDAIVATYGLAGDGADPVTGPPDGTRVRAVEVSYSYASELEDEDSLIHRALAVPLQSEGAVIGYLSVYTRDGARRFDSADVHRLEELAHRAGPALENAQRFREARQLADLDALTGLHNRRYFHETLARESARAHRYGRKLSLVVFDLDDFKDVNDRIGHLAGDAVLAEAAERIRAVTRSADVACRVGGDEFAVIVPESGIEQAGQLFTRVQSALSGRPIGRAGRLHISAGLAELAPDDDSISFFERADQALLRAKEAGKGRSIAAGA